MRLLGEEGLAAFIEDPPDGSREEVWVLGDDPSMYVAMPGRVPLEVRDSPTPEEHQLPRVSFDLAASAGRVGLRGHDLRRPSEARPSQASSSDPWHRGLGGEVDEYEADAQRGGPFLPERGDWMLASTRLAELQKRTTTLRARTTCKRISPGRRVGIVGHEVSEVDGDYVVTSVRHRGLTASGDVSYQAELTAVPATVLYRARPPHRRLVQVAEPALVVGAPAFPIAAACQHIATLLTLMRGYPLDWMGSSTIRAVGLSCSDSMGEMPIFGGDAKALGGAKAVVPAPNGGKWYPPMVASKASEPAGKQGVDVNDPKTWVDKTTPATIFVYDPNHGVTRVPLSRFEKTYINREARAEFMRTRTSPGANDPSWDRLVRQHLEEITKLTAKIAALEAPSASGTNDAVKKKRAKELEDAKKRKDLLEARDPKLGVAFDYTYKVPDVKKRWAERIAGLDVTINAERRSASATRLKKLEDEKVRLQKELAEVEIVVKDRTRTDHPEAAFDQLPGSHVHGVLRVHANGQKLQVFDTGIGAHYGLLKAGNDSVTQSDESDQDEVEG
jgi:hypothetical protein